MEAAKTSTFTVHHDRCKPGEWTAKDILAIADFVRTGDMRYAAYLSRNLGMQLVLSEHHVPKGGTLEEIGWCAADAIQDGPTDDLAEIADDLDITEVVRIYRGPVEYAVKFGVDDGNGEFGGYEHEIKTTEAEADAFLRSLTEAA